jgi:hypothetical protein
MKTDSIAHPRRPALAATLALGLAAASFGTLADSGVKSCPDSPSRLPYGHGPSHPTLDEYDAFDAMLQPMAMPRQLLPGTRRATPGLPMTGHLAGPAIVSESIAFTFLSRDGHVVSGTLQTEVVDADCSCDFHWQVQMSPSSWLGVDQVIVRQFPHPEHQLYAAWRNDELPLGVPPDHAQRSSGTGTTITFKFAAVVMPGQDSRWMFLDSAVDKAKKAGTLQLRATDGSLSAPIATWVPVWP